MSGNEDNDARNTRIARSPNRLVSPRETPLRYRVLNRGTPRQSYRRTLCNWFWALAFILSVLYFVLTVWWASSQAFDDTASGLPGGSFGWRSQNSLNTTDNSSSSNTNDQKQLRIVLCAKVTSETPYLLEWIEFHRLQGVDKFVLYHDAIPSEPKTVASALELELLAAFYRDVERRRRESEDRWWTEEDTIGKAENPKGRSPPSQKIVEDTIEVQPASMLVPDLWPALKSLDHNTVVTHRLLQPALVSDCVERYKNRAEYVMHIDVDEFVYSPKFDTVWEYLQYETSRRRWKAFLFGRSVGFYIPSVNFGSSGQFWDFHNVWVPDSSSGTITAYFDPRDSSLFQFLQQFNESLLTKDLSLTSLDIARQLDAFRTSRIKKLSFFPTQVEEFAQFVHQRLVNDFPSNAPSSHLTDSLIVPSFRSTLEDSDFKQLEQLIGTALNQIRSDHITPLRKLQDERFREDVEPSASNNSFAINQAQSSRALNPSTISNTEDQLNEPIQPQSHRPLVSSNQESLSGKHQRLRQSSSVISSQLLERIKLYHKYLANSILFYPLIIEEQIRRGPSVTSHIDSKSTGKKIASELFPACQVSQQKRKQFLIDREGFQAESNELERTLWLYSFVCQSRLPGTITMAGKAIYFTSSIRRSERSRSSGRLRGCHRPSVHGCSHWIFGGRLHWADASSELRLDHHQFRSYERRSFGLPSWRGGPLGYPKDMNYTVLQEFLDSIVDTGKLKFIPRLRERLSQLHVLPKMPDYAWNLKSKKGKVTEIVIETQNLTKQCSAIELLGEHQVMCPHDFPYVGYFMTRHPPPHPYQPYSWCSDVPMDSTINPWKTTLSLSQSYPNETHLNDLKLFDKHTVLCPGYGETRCCDFNPGLQQYQTDRFASQTKVWSSTIHKLESILYGV